VEGEKYLLKREGEGKHGFWTCGHIGLLLTEQAMLFIKKLHIFSFWYSMV
jgi:hypothetical protein